jgi:hypothetical protein
MSADDHGIGLSPHPEGRILQDSHRTIAGMHPSIDAAVAQSGSLIDESRFGSHGGEAK